MPADVVDHFIAAIERKDLDHALQHLTEDCEYDNVPMGTVTGRDAVRATLGPFLERFEQIQWIVRLDRFGGGDHWVELPVAGLFVIRHGQIALWRDYFDRDSLLGQMATLS